MMSVTQLDNTWMHGYAVLSLLRGHDIGYVTASVRTEGSTADGNEVLDERSDRSLNLEFFAQKKLFCVDMIDERLVSPII